MIRVFSHPSTDDEQRDVKLQKTIRSFQWVTEQHLDADIDMQNEEVQKLVEETQDCKLLIIFLIVTAVIFIVSCKSLYPMITLQVAPKRCSGV